MMTITPVPVVTGQQQQQQQQQQHQQVLQQVLPQAAAPMQLSHAGQVGIPLRHSMSGGALGSGSAVRASGAMTVVPGALGGTKGPVAKGPSPVSTTTTCAPQAAPQ